VDRAGADIVIATPWAVRRNDKTDFNDLIKRDGAEAVRARIASALHPPYNPVRRLTVKQGRAAIAKSVRAFYQAVRDYNAKRRDAEAKAKAELTADAPFEPEVIEAHHAWAVARAASLEARRLAKLHPPSSEAVSNAKAAARAARERARIASAAAAEFKAQTSKIQDGIRKAARIHARAAAGPYPVHGVKVEVGTGKSRANLETITVLIPELRAAKDKRAIGIAIPAHALGDQQAERLAAMTNATGIKAAVWRSRKAPNPRHPDYTDPTVPKDRKSAMCLDLDAVADAEEALADPQTAVCQKKMPDGSVRECHYFAECPFQKQRKLKPDVWLFAHELLFNTAPAVIGDLAALAVDESAWQDALFGAERPSPLLLDTLTREDATVPGDPLATEQLISTRRNTFEALSCLDLPGEGERPTPALRSELLAQGIDAASASAAYAMEWKRKAEADIYPNMPPKERKEAVKAVIHNKLVAKLGILRKAFAALLADDGPERSGWVSVGTHQTKDGTAQAIYLKGRKPVHESWHVPTILMDATMLPELVRLFWPTMELTADIRVTAPHQHITQVIDRSYSKEQLSKAAGFRDVHAIITREARRYAPHRCLVIAQLDVKEALRERGNLPANVTLAHHNNIAGRDDWGDVAAQIVIGRTAPSPGAVASITEALTGAAVDPIGGWYPKAEAHREMADGTFRPAQTDQHPHPVANAVRWSINEGELIQILGRPRGVNRASDDPVDILVMTDAVLPFPIETTISCSGAQ
jgi:putative DNA primase/helicase